MFELAKRSHWLQTLVVRLISAVPPPIEHNVGKTIALKKIYSLLKEGGTFYLMDVVYPSAVEDYESFFGEIIMELEDTVGPEYTQEYYDHISREFSTLDWIMENLLREAGFTILQSSLENRFLATYICTK